MVIFKYGSNLSLHTNFDLQKAGVDKTSAAQQALGWWVYTGCISVQCRTIIFWSAESKYCFYICNEKRIIPTTELNNINKIP